MEMMCNRPPATSKLLLVDDNHTFTQVVARALARRGFEIAVAHDIASAINLVDSNTRYAIVDLRLGDTTGLDLLAFFKNTNPTMRILLMSGYASAETIAEALQLGAACYLAKPADVETILNALIEG